MISIAVAYQGVGLDISIAHTAAGRIYMEARKFPKSSQASGVRNQ